MSTPDSMHRDQNWTQRSRELLDLHAERLDPVQSRHLLQARQRALASVRRAQWQRWAVGLGAATAASLSLFVLLKPRLEQSIEPLPGIHAPKQMTTAPIEKALTLPDTDLELITNPDEYAMLQDLEFYAWLEDSEHGG